MMMYNKIVEECFFYPQHVGILDLSVALTGCFNSTKLTLYMRCSADGIIKQVRFKATGHPYLIAGLEWVGRRCEGHTIDTLINLDYQIVIKELAIASHHYPIALQVVQAYKEMHKILSNTLRNYHE